MVRVLYTKHAEFIQNIDKEEALRWRINWKCKKNNIRQYTTRASPKLIRESNIAGATNDIENLFSLIEGAKEVTSYETVLPVPGETLIVRLVR